MTSSLYIKPSRPLSPFLSFSSFLVAAAGVEYDCVGGSVLFYEADDDMFVGQLRYFLIPRPVV